MSDGSATRFSIATSWSSSLIDGLLEIEASSNESKFVELFGSHQVTPIGSGRPAYRLPLVADDAFVRHVQHARSCGITFNYLLNSPRLPASGDWQRDTARLLEFLATAGVRTVTVARPEVARLVSQERPEMELCVSLIAGVDTEDAARRFEDLGAARIVLNPHTVNRRLDRIESIRRAVRCELEVYANIACLDGCPARDAHYGFLARASQPAGERTCDDPFLGVCARRYLQDPVALLESPFVRPDDIAAYREAGVDRFKLSDRTLPTDALLGTARAYAQRRFDGDLFALVFRSGAKFTAALPRAIRQSPPSVPAIHIDNRALGELDFLAGTQIRDARDRRRFYERAAAAALRIDGDESVQRWRDLLTDG